MSHSLQWNRLSQRSSFSSLWSAVVLLTLMQGISLVHAQSSTPAQLQRILQPLAEAHAGEVAVSVRVLDANNNVCSHWNYHGERVMPTASLIKLPVMIEAYRQVSAGDVSLSDTLTLSEEDQVPGSGILTEHFSPGLSLSLRDAIRLMIRYSDNTATNLVVDHIGLPSTSKTMADLGWPETQLHAKVFRRDTSLAPQRSEIYGLGSTTAEDMTDLLVRLERGELVTPAACQAMLEHLRTCDDSNKLPRELPAGFVVAHKTGTVERSRTAAGIISGPGVKFAICVLTDKNEDTSWSNTNAAEVLIGKMARAVVDLLSPEKSADTADAADMADTSDAAGTRATPRTQTLSTGASGSLVESLQRTLNARVAAGLGVDGDFGSATEAAVKKFQSANNLLVTGVVDSATWLALGSLIEEDPPVPAPEVVNAIELPLAPALDVEAPPEVTATAWISVDLDSGGVLAELDSHRPLPIASTTKVMTAYLIFELAAADPSVLDELVTFSERADSTLGSTSGVRAGEALPVREVMYGLLLPSGNDAAVALAEHFGDRLQPAASGTSEAAVDEQASERASYDHFVAAMNRRAAELGMSDSHFTNPHGLPDDAHLSSAADLAVLARAAWQLPHLQQVVRTRVHGAQVRGEAGYTRNLRWTNTNRLLDQAGFSGMKTGTTTAAGACLIAVGKSSKGSSETIVVVLGSTSSAARYVDARNIFAWSWRLPHSPSRQGRGE